MQTIKRDQSSEKQMLEAVDAAKKWRAPIVESELADKEIYLFCSDGDLEKALEDTYLNGLRVKHAFLPKDKPAKNPSVPTSPVSSIAKIKPETVVFAGRPRKFLFSSTKTLGKRVFWLNPELVPKIKSKLADRKIIENHKKDLLFVWEHLEDTSSKDIFASIVKSRLLNDNGYLKISNYREYCHRTVGAVKGDIVVDAGAHVGKISVEFAKKVGAEGFVHAFEPDEKSYAELAMRSEIKSKIVPHKLGVWKQSTHLRFNTSDASSASHAISESGTNLIDVVSLDSFFASGRFVEKPTLLKFDVEGAELEAIEGAQQLISDFKPRLMISVYHERDHLWSILRKVLSINPTYRFYLGHHNFTHTETDLYCY